MEKMYELKIKCNVGIEVRRVPSGTHCTNRVYWDEQSLVDEILSYGVKEKHEINDMLTELRATADYIWVSL